MAKLEPMNDETVFEFSDKDSGLTTRQFKGSFMRNINLSQALAVAAKLNKPWVLDNRYRVRTTTTAGVKDVNDNLVTVFSVAAHPNNPITNRTTNLRDEHSRHGGLYYLGNGVRLGALALSHVRDLTAGSLMFHQWEATTAAFPYPVRMLRTKYEQVGHWAIEPLLIAALSHIDFEVVTVDKSIFHSHYQVAKDLGTRQPILFLDADFQIDRNLGFTFKPVLIEEEKYVHLWKVKNPINGLVYGHGGPKLLSLDMFEKADPPFQTPDMTMHLGAGIKIVDQEVGIHQYNTTDLNIWRTAYREAYKLTQTVLDGNTEKERKEAEERLTVWTTKPAEPDDWRWRTYKDSVKENQRLSADGAIAGRSAFRDDGVQPARINDYGFLEAAYENYLKAKHDQTSPA